MRHTFQPRWPEDETGYEPPQLTSFVYRDALDVVRYSELEPLTTWYTYPHVWHLDDGGVWRCCSRGSSFDSVRRYADEPEIMLHCRETPVKPPCPNNWVMLEPRRPHREDEYQVSEEDARAFIILRGRLAVYGISLLDVVVFDQDNHWWSLHEVTSGTTAWTFPSAPDGDRRCA